MTNTNTSTKSVKKSNLVAPDTACIKHHCEQLSALLELLHEKSFDPQAFPRQLGTNLGIALDISSKLLEMVSSVESDEEASQ